MRKPVVAANWKMNKTLDEAMDFAKEFKRRLPHGTVGKVDVVICPVFVHLTALAMDTALPSGVVLGAQDAHWEERGAFTGCVSPVMIKDIKARYALVGHSERRQYFNESNDILSKKLAATLKAGLIPIFCVGEGLQDRETGRTFKALEEQMAAIKNVPGDLLGDPSGFVVAYEPVWAIGTGRNAAPAQAEEAHAFLRELLGRVWARERADNTRILYGGSVTPENFGPLMGCANVDGGLVGGASLDVQKFLKLIEVAAG